MVALGAISAIVPLVLIERRTEHQSNLVSVPLLCADGETRMTRPLTFFLALWRSATQDAAHRIQEQEVDCPISDYTDAIESNPNNSTTYFARGTAHLMAFDFDSAIADFTRAIEIEPNDASAYTNRGSAHYEKGEFNRALADLNKALELDPKSAPAYCNLGWTYEAMHDERKAIAHYRKALEIDPSLEAARDNLKLLDA
jgi:tetratricopeptide (TPR) repeat protein